MSGPVSTGMSASFGGHTTIVSLPSHPVQLSLLPSAVWQTSTSQRAVILCGWEVRQDSSVHIWINVCGRWNCDPAKHMLSWALQRFHNDVLLLRCATITLTPVHVVMFLHSIHGLMHHVCGIDVPSYMSFFVDSFLSPHPCSKQVVRFMSLTFPSVRVVVHRCYCARPLWEEVYDRLVILV